MQNELQFLRAGSLTLCTVYLSRDGICWVIKRKQRLIKATFITGAEVIPGKETDFMVYVFKPAKNKFAKYRFRCPSYFMSSQWVISVEDVAYPDSAKRSLAVLLNPISGKKRARKIYYSKLLPKMQATPTSHALFGEG